MNEYLLHPLTLIATYTQHMHKNVCEWTLIKSYCINHYLLAAHA